jgi:hypothetical protein
MGGQGRHIEPLMYQGAVVRLGAEGGGGDYELCMGSGNGRGEAGLEYEGCQAEE